MTNKVETIVAAITANLKAAGINTVTVGRRLSRMLATATRWHLSKKRRRSLS